MMTNMNATATANLDFAAASGARSCASGASVSAKSLADFDHRCEVLRERLGNEGFLANKGLGNEVGFYLFCYDPALELHVRAFAGKLTTDADTGVLGCNVLEYNLYDVFLALCERSRILNKIPAMEERRGLERLETQLKRAIGVDDFADAIAEAAAQGRSIATVYGQPSGDGGSAANETQPVASSTAASGAPSVVLLTGVGEVYPVLRLHGLFETLQQRGCFQNIPVVAFYPGVYTGQSLSLFNSLKDGNYYRAFDLL